MASLFKILFALKKEGETREMYLIFACTQDKLLSFIFKYALYI